MSKFYTLLWLKWAFRLTLCSVVLAALFSLFITTFTYFSQGSATLNVEIVTALKDIALFWFPLVWSFTLLIALFRSTKYIFNNCLGGYQLKLFSCDLQEELEVIGYGDLVKVWRKWFMLIIWLVGAQMILAVVFTKLLTTFDGVFEWFNIFWLFGFVLVAGYFSFILLGNRCKRVKVSRC